MRNVMLVVGLVVLLVVGAALWIEEGEVVTLRTSDAAGRSFETELWIAEYRGDLYLRGAPSRAWVERLRARPRVELVRAGRIGTYQARLVHDADVAAGVEAAMAEKYGNANRLAGAVFDRRPPIAVRLDPIDPADPPGWQADSSAQASSADTRGP